MLGAEVLGGRGGKFGFGFVGEEVGVDCKDCDFLGGSNGAGRPSVRLGGLMRG